MAGHSLRFGPILAILLPCVIENPDVQHDDDMAWAVKETPDGSANDTRDGDRTNARREHGVGTALGPERPAMIRRVTAPEQLSAVEPVLTWRVTLNERPAREWRHHFLDHACEPGLFFDSRIRIDDAAIIFELEPAALRTGLERIDACIGEANAACGYAVEEAESRASTDTILVVDDERGVRALASEILEQAGFTVVDSGDPKEALRMAQAQTFQLLLTDVVMPIMSGRELAERVESVNPQTKVLFMSAYSSNVLPTGAPFIAKPFTPPALISAVRDALTRRSSFSRPKA